MSHRHRPQRSARGGPAQFGRSLTRGRTGGNVASPVRSEAELARLPLRAFDWRAIVASPASGTLGVSLLGATATDVIPAGFRGLVEQIVPYLEGPGGRVVGPRIDASCTIAWHVLIDGRPAVPYGAVFDLVSDWCATSPRPLLEVPEQKQLLVTVDFTDPLGLFSFVGVRVSGRMERLP